MTRILVARCSGLLAIITTYIAVVPGLAFAQKFEYRDVIKTLEVKAPPRRHFEPRSEDTNVETKATEVWYVTKPETKNAKPKPAIRKSAETKPAEVKYVEPKPADAKHVVEPKPQTNDELPTVDWLATRWHMSMEQVATIGHLVPTTAAERRDHTSPDLGIALLRARYVEKEIPYTAFYWFHDNKLVAVAIKSGDFRHWPKVNKSLEQTYGKPSEEKSKTSTNEGMRCVVTDRKWISERQDTVIKFLAQDCDRSPTQHWNFYSIQYEPNLTAGKIALQAARF